jgi:hypothetical protein
MVFYEMQRRNVGPELTLPKNLKSFFHTLLLKFFNGSFFLAMMGLEELKLVDS